MEDIYIETIQFDRIFDVRKIWAKGGPFMRFKFDANGLTNVKASACVHAGISSGATVTVALSKKNDWETILGFWDPAKGKFFVRPTDLCDVIAMLGMCAFGFATQLLIILLNWDFWPAYRNFLWILFSLAVPIAVCRLTVPQLLLERRAAIELSKFAATAR